MTKVSDNMKDQKHSSNVVRTHYQKKRSRDIALEDRAV